MTEHVLLREFIERVILENDRRIEARFAALDKALQLQAAGYPTTRDFNALKTHVDVELASRSGSSSTVTTLFQVLTVVSLLSSSLFAYLLYAK